jgi:hypothetical protein
MLFRASAVALQKLAGDPRFVGGQIGMVGVLHTWKRDLNYHPHVHYLVPAGGLSQDGQTCLPTKKDFLLPVKPLSILFRAKFRDALKKTDLFAEVPHETWMQDWVVHCRSVGNGVAALKYLAPYIFRVAISNNRILKLEDGRVTYRYVASDTGKTRYCTVASEEFIRRFLQHVLPKGFIKVHYYVFFSSGNRHRLRQTRKLLGDCHSSQSLDGHQAKEIPPEQVICCPKCGQVMQLTQTVRTQHQRPL